MRIVSLVPAATEILAAVGGEGLLVGRSHECDHPPRIADRPALTRQRPVARPAGGSEPLPPPTPAQIDAHVRASLAGGHSLYELDAQRLEALRPDLVLTQDLCAVCSIDLDTVRGVVERLPHPCRVLSLNPHTVEDVLEDMVRVGAAAGLESQALTEAGILRERMYQALEHVNPFTDGPHVAFLEWTDPLFVAGHWTPQLIERAGGRHLLNPTAAPPEAGAAAGMQLTARRAGKSITVPAPVLAASAPDALIICPCGVDLPGARAMAADLSRQAWWADLPAVRAGRVAIVDGNQYFSRPGPRLVEGLEFLVGWINGIPGLIPPGFAWERWDART